LAFQNYDVCLMECQVAETAEVVPVIFTINQLPNGCVEMIPCAELLTDSPHRILNPPRADGKGFVTQAELWGQLN
jgi:hypothetical protein